jgi:hypothetical protein
LPTTAEVVENQNNKALSSIDDSNAEEVKMKPERRS